MTEHFTGYHKFVEKKTLNLTKTKAISDAQVFHFFGGINSRHKSTPPQTVCTDSNASAIDMEFHGAVKHLLPRDRYTRGWPCGGKTANKRSNELHMR